VEEGCADQEYSVQEYGEAADSLCLLVDLLVEVSRPGKPYDVIDYVTHNSIDQQRCLPAASVTLTYAIEPMTDSPLPIRHKQPRPVGVA
jgi:hypothetical protein